MLVAKLKALGFLHAELVLSSILLPPLGNEPVFCWLEEVPKEFLFDELLAPTPPLACCLII